MKKFISTVYLVLISILFTVSSFAQHVRENGTAILYTENSLFVDVIKTGAVAGTPFYIDNFVKGRVLFNENDATETILMDFDGFTQNIITKEDQVYKKIIIPNTQGFVFLDDNDEPKEYFANGFENKELGITPDTFVKVLYDGDVKLIAHFTVIYKPANFRSTVNRAHSDEYDSDLSYYIIGRDGEYKKTRLRTRNLIKDLGLFEKELKAFVKKNKLNAKKELDAAKIIMQFENLRNNS